MTVSTGAKGLDLRAFLRPGDRIVWGQACGEPTTLVEALIEQAPSIGRVSAFAATSFSGILSADAAEKFSLVSMGAIGALRTVAAAGRLGIVPCHVGQVAAMIEQGLIGCDVAFVQVSPADAEGNHSFGLINDFVQAAVNKARVVIAEVNERVPFTFGDGVLPASRIDCAVHVSRTPVEVPPAKISETDLAIAKIVAGYVEDGAVLQVGIGATPDAILRLLHDRRDLGVHSGMIGDGLVDLVEAGVITNALKPIDAGVSITGALIGTKRLYEFAHRNPKIAVRSSSYTHSDATLSRLTRLVTINGDGSRPDGTGECRAERRSVPGRHRRTSRLCPRRQPLARRSLHHCFAGNGEGRQDQSRDDSPVRTRHDRTQRRGCDRHRIRCDVFVGNDPDYGGGHLPDYNVYAPVFDDHGELVLIQALQAHQGDTGGKDPCGFTLEATDIFTEGLAIPCLKLLHRGEKRRDVIKLLERNNRFPSFAGDLAAMIGGVQLSVKRLQGVLRKWGSEAVKAAINYSIDHTEKRLREEVAAWRDGSYEATVLIDHDTLGTKDVEVHVTCTVKGDQLTVDLTGSDARPELVGVWNTFGNSRSYVMTQIAAAIDPTIVKNEGLFHAVEIVCPENTIVHPPVNKPAALGSFHPACEIIEAVCVASCRAICRPRH